MKQASPSRWGLILAGGDGTRLLPLTRRIAGDERPKQFCRVLPHETLLEQSLRRCRRLLPPERTLAVVVRAHERFYAPIVAGVPGLGLVVQPDNRGTAPAILYGLLRLQAMAPGGAVAILPSDHYVSDDDRFMAHVAAAFRIVQARPRLLVLLGSMPRTPEPEYGWIEPGHRIPIDSRGDLARVRRFWEKPPLAIAQELLSQGCMWNTFVMVAAVPALLSLLARTLPELVARFAAIRWTIGSAGEGEIARAVYARSPGLDFSRQVLVACPPNLAVLRLADVDWDDLGEPHRVLATLARLGVRPEWSPPVASVSA